MLKFLSKFTAKTVKEFNEGLHEDDVGLTAEEKNMLYAKAGEELENGHRDAGVWAEALAKGKGNPQGQYIEYRFQSLKEKLLLEKETIQKELERVKVLEARERAEALALEEAKMKALKKREEWIVFFVIVLLMALFTAIFFLID